jgi:DNA-binding CsgD family transcriptional regulator
MADELAAGHRAFAGRSWKEAYRALGAAPREQLDASDLEQLAVAAYLIGKDDDSLAAWDAAHRRHLEAGAPAEAARCSFWLALCLLLQGQGARAGGWLTRTDQLVDAAGGDCAARGYLLIPSALGALADGDAAGARDAAIRAGEIGRRLDDADLTALGTLGVGQALIALGDTAAGTTRLDEVMVSVAAGEVGPVTTGIVYCAVILECMHLYDLGRAAEWTGALTTWCDDQPDLVPYRGQCLVHRSQLEQAAGRWRDASAIVESAYRHLQDPPHPALGLACYQQAELHRLVGAFDEAAAGYRDALRYGYEPVPGLALLELDRGDAQAAAATMRRVLQEAGSAEQRPGLLAAAVDVLRAAGDTAGARAAADELDALARSGSRVLDAMAAQAIGTVLLSEGDPAGALAHLRVAAAAWHDLRMPYDGARTAVLLGLACAALGDRATAAMELDRALGAFTDLGARPDLDRLQPLRAGLAPPGGPADTGSAPSPLSVREREVLVHIAAGKTNRQIAADLTISEHTVGRHVENIFTKLGVTNRAAATAYAYEHQLL